MTGWRRALIWLVIGWCSVATVRADDDPPKRKEKAQNEKWAVLIAVDDYLNAGDLKYCGADQRAMKERLIKSGFDERQVYLLHDDATDKKLLPFKANIERQLQTVLSFAERGDFVLVAFSGHGVHFNKVSYLCPTDAKLDDPNSLISMDWVYDKLSKSKADLRLVMVDACRNDPRPPGQRSLSSDEVREGTRAFVETTDKRLPEGIVLLNSCSEGEVSQEDEKLGHGVFMHFVLQGLAGQADKDGDQKVTFNELVRYTSKETKLHVEKRYNDSQRPKVKGNLTGEVFDFELASLSATPSRPTLPNVPVTANGAKTITNSVGLSLTLIPAGDFEMGSPETPDELLRRFPYGKRESVVDEQPVHKVKLTKSFYMGTYEVTLGQFLKFYHDASYKTDSEKDGKGGWGYDPNNKGNPFEEKAKYRPWSWGFEGQTNEHPVVNVSWNDAHAFCEWLSRKEGKTYRLPTEAEWEYACRAGTKSRYWNSSDPEELVSIDNVWDSSANSRFRTANWTPQNFVNSNDGYAFSAPVGRFKPNPFGVYDMHGNVAEWCEDWYDENYYGKSPPEDPKGAASGSSRVIRGGGWSLFAVLCRAAGRNEDSPSSRYHGVGFRVVRVSE